MIQFIIIINNNNNNMNTNNNTLDTKPLTRKQKKWRRYKQYLNKKKLEKYGFAYYDDNDDNDNRHYDMRRHSSKMFDYDLSYDLCGLDRIVAQIYAERNSVTHKQQIYDELDKFIAENEPTENIREFAISGRDLYDGKKMYTEMKNDPNPSPKYEIFGSNGCGYQCFGLYKSKDQNMYIIIVVQTPTNYIKIENETLFGN
jgi:hypothetical protein